MLAAQCQVAQETLGVMQAAAAKDKSLVNCPQPGCEGLAAAGGGLSPLNEVPPQLLAPDEAQTVCTTSACCRNVFGCLGSSRQAVSPLCVAVRLHSTMQDTTWRALLPAP